MERRGRVQLLGLPHTWQVRRQPHGAAHVTWLVPLLQAHHELFPELRGALHSPRGGAPQ